MADETGGTGAARQKDQAEANLGKARQAVDAFFTEVSESALLNQPQLEPLRRQLLEKALKFYQDLSTQRTDDPELRAGLADVAFRVGKIKQLLGDSAGTKDAYQQALDMYEHLTREHPEVPKYRSSLADTLGNLSYAELFAGHPREAIATAQRGLDTDPSQASIRTNLAHGYLLDNQYAKALAIYTENKDVKLPEKGGKTFGETVLEDFKELRAKGITHPDMAKIERLLHEGASKHD